MLGKPVSVTPIPWFSHSFMFLGGRIFWSSLSEMPVWEQGREYWFPSFFIFLCQLLSRSSEDLWVLKMLW